MLFGTSIPTVPLPGTELTRRLKDQNRVYARDIIGWQYYDGNFPLFEPDEPMTAEQMHLCAKKIMGRLYRFKYMFLIALHTFSFPAIIFFLHNLRLGWQKWYRPWRNSLIRFGGWMILKKWNLAFRQNKFSQKLQSAHQHLLHAR